ncbi:MAG: flagellar motor switch protein FliN [Phycisphaerales bacterium]
MSDETTPAGGMSAEDAAMAAAAFEAFAAPSEPAADASADIDDPVAAAMAEMGMEDDPVAAAMAEMAEAEAEADAGADADAGFATFTSPEFDAGATSDSSSDLGMLDDVSLKISVELGRTSMFVDDVLRLVPDAVVELDKAAGDPVDVFVNGRHVARGEVLVLNENFCVRINEIIRHSDQDM